MTKRVSLYAWQVMITLHLFLIDSLCFVPFLAPGKSMGL
jgi:hypothetical protein